MTKFVCIPWFGSGNTGHWFDCGFLHMLKFTVLNIYWCPYSYSAGEQCYNKSILLLKYCTEKSFNGFLYLNLDYC